MTNFVGVSSPGNVRYEQLGATLRNVNDDGMAFALGKAVRRRRVERELSQKDLGKLANVHYQTIAGVELGRVRSSYKLDRIAKALRTDVRTLMLEAEETADAMFPDVGKLTRALMERQHIDEEELAQAMNVDLDDVERLLRGDTGPLLWGAAAVALGVSPRVFERAAVDGFDATRGLPGSQDEQLRDL